MKNIKKYLWLVGVIIFGLACSSDSGLSIIRNVLPFITHLLIVSGITFTLLYSFLMILDEDGTKEAFFDLKSIRKYLGTIGLMVFLLVCISVSKQNTMEGILPYITHMLIISGIIFMILYTLLMIIDGDNVKEVFFRSIALTLSFLIYYLSVVFNISIADLIIQNLERTKPAAIIIVNVIFPLTFSTVTAYFINRIFKNKNVLATRVIIMLSTLIIILFVDIYVISSNIERSTKLLPNTSFVIGLILYIILGYNDNIRSKNIVKEYDSSIVN